MKAVSRLPAHPAVATAAAIAALVLLPGTANAADQIAFTCGNGDELCVVDPDSGAPPTNLTNTAAASEKKPSWSPDGTRLAYYATLPGSLPDVFTLSVAQPETAANVSQTADRHEGFSPIEWSPSGGRVAYETDPNSSAEPLGSEVYVSPYDGTAVPFAVGSSAADETAPTWSPDGSRIAFARSGSVYMGNADGSGTAQALSAGYTPDWSADGTRIATATNSTIRVVRVDGTGTPANFGNVSGLIVNGPYFSPDSTRVMWATQNTIYIQAADGSSPAITINPPNGRPLYPSSWSPDSSRIAFSGFDEGTGIDLFVANSDGTGTPRPVATTYLQSIDPVWKPGTGAPPVDPGPDPPSGETRPPVTISLATFRKPFITAGPNPFVPIAYVSCSYPSPAALAAGCKFDADGIVNSSAKSSPGGLRAAKKIKFGSGSVALAYGEEGELRLKVSKAGKKLLKPGRKLKIKVTIKQRIGTDPVVTTKKTLKLKVPKKAKG